MNRLQEKIALVTGGTSGIGLATAKLFAEEGAFVFITGRRPAELETAVAEIGPNAKGIQGDIANLCDLDRLYEEIKKAKGRLDTLFANRPRRIRPFRFDIGGSLRQDFRRQRGGFPTRPSADIEREPAWPPARIPAPAIGLPIQG